MERVPTGGEKVGSGREIKSKIRIRKKSGSVRVKRDAPRDLKGGQETVISRSVLFWGTRECVRQT